MKGIQNPYLLQSLDGFPEFSDGDKRMMAEGIATVNYPGGGPLSAVTTFNHGLPGQPTNVQLTGIDGAGSVTAYAVVAVTATQISIQGTDVSGVVRGPGNLSCYWVAFYDVP